MGRPPIVIETHRLLLRELDLDDAEFVLELLNEAGFLRFIGDKGVRTVHDARDYIIQGPMHSYDRFGFGLYHTSLRADATALGICGLVKRDSLEHVDLGFAFLSRHWSRGYATEAAAAVLVHGRQHLGLQRIVAITAPDNHACIAVLEKIGLHHDGWTALTEEGPVLKLFAPPAAS